MQAPPSRYRVIERGGRLVVLDSAVGGAPLTAKDLLPDRTGDQDMPSLQYPASIDEEDPEPARELVLEVPAARMTPYAAGQSPIAEPPGLLRNVAATVCSDRRDGDGRLQWTTARWFDARAPRTVTLSDKAGQQLGFATLALLATAVFAVIFAAVFGFVGWVILFVAGSLLRQAKPATTAWIDRLERI